MQLFLQLDLDDLPDPELTARFGGGGLLQLFYCTGTHRLARPLDPANFSPGGVLTGEAAMDMLRMACPAGGGRPFEAGNLTRIVRPSGPAQPSLAYENEDEPLPPRLITGWRRVTDLPHAEEHAELGLKIDYDFHRRTATVTCEPLGLVFRDMPEDVSEQLATALRGDKLAGWPSWVQGVEYPDCPRCGRRMQHVFQLDSNDHLAFMFGDVGRGHVTQCPSHPDVVAFGWACS